MIAYTCLFGDYEELTDQPIARSSNADFICLTDRHDLKSDTFEVVQVDPKILTDTPRSSRHPKIFPYSYFPLATQTLYFDNSVLLKQTPENIYEHLTNGHSFGMIKNSVYPKLIEEFAAVYRSGLDDPVRVNEFLNSVILNYPDLLDSEVYWGGVIARDLSDESLKLAMESWWHLVLRYSRRDQLSLPLSLNLNDTFVHSIKLDQSMNDFFDWPVSANRKRTGYLNNVKDTTLFPLIKLRNEIELLKFKFGEESHSHSLTTAELMNTQTELMNTQTELMNTQTELLETQALIRNVTSQVIFKKVWRKIRSILN